MKIKSATELYQFFSDFDAFGKPPAFDSRNKFFNTLSAIHHIYLQVCIVLIIFYSNIFKVNSCKEDNVKFNMTEVCGLFSYTWMPFDVDYTPIKEIYLVIQVFGIYYVYLNSGMMAWVVLETLLHLLLRIQHVKEVFLEALNERDSQERESKFNFAVKYHVAILR